MSNGRVLIYGGNGALGSVILSYFKNKNFWTLNVDLLENNLADNNIVVNKNDSWLQQENFVFDQMSKIIGEKELDAIFCVAGGWLGGNAADKDMVKNAEIMYKQSVWSSVISARLASKYLNDGGLLQLTGAAAALQGTPGMIGYGMAKSAVHQLVKSLSVDNSGMPKDSSALAISPVILDTPMNRKWMPKADFKAWTPLIYIANLLYDWTVNKSSRPSNGSIVKISTKDGNTTLEMH